MTIEHLHILSLAAYILAGVLFLVSVALFFLLNVPKLFGDISGVTAKKAIESIRLQNETTGDRTYKRKPVSVNKVPIAKNTPLHGGALSKGNGTETASSAEMYHTAELFPPSDGRPSFDFTSNETTILETEVPGKTLNDGETTVLSENQIADNEMQSLHVDVEMSFIGSTEIIE